MLYKFIVWVFNVRSSNPIRIWDRYKLSPYIHFLIKFIYNIFYIIKKYSFNFKQTFPNSVFSTLQSKTLENLSQKLIKLNKSTIQNKKERKNKTHIKVNPILLNM